jgi:hypothetical protein
MRPRYHARGLESEGHPRIVNLNPSLAVEFVDSRATSTMEARQNMLADLGEGVRVSTKKVEYTKVDLEGLEAREWES